MFLLDNKPLALDTAFTHNDIQYPANWLRLASQAERKALGITEQPDPVVVQPKVDLNVLKKQAIDNVKQTARNELSKTDWMVIRKAERSIDLPIEVSMERNVIHDWADAAEVSVNAAKTIEDLQSVKMSPDPVVRKKENTGKK